MKIFNWVHRRFNNHKEDDELAKDAKRSNDQEIISIDNDQSQDQFMSGWKGAGIFLTIGTFGYDPLKNEEEEEEEEPYYNDDRNEEDDNFNDVITNEETNNVNGGEIEQIIDSEHEEEVKPLIKHAAAAASAYYAPEDLLKMEEEVIDGEKEVDVVLSKKERKTLAELFSAEKSEEGNKSKSTVTIDAENTSKGRENSRDENPRIEPSATGKKCAAGKDAAADRPMGKRLHRLVKKMLKKKIHPELAGLNNNNNKHVDVASKSASAAGSRESDSLLSIIQDVVM